MNASMQFATPMQIAFWLGRQSRLPSIEQIQSATGCSLPVATRLHHFAAHDGHFDFGRAPTRTRKKLIERICDALELQPMTTHELTQCLSCSPNSTERYITELHQAGCIRVVGKIPTRCGRPRNLWGLT